MRYASSEAYDLYSSSAAPKYSPRRQNDREFKVIKGEGKRASAPALSASVSVAIKVVVATILAFVIIGFTRIGISMATVSTLSENSQIRSEIKQAKTSSKDLKIEESLLTNADRIEKIASENYGMVYSAPSETIQLNSN